MYKACIFDLDGTLTDTLDSLTYSTNETMKEMNLPEITKEQCRMFVGNGAKVLIQKALEAAGVPEEEFFPETFHTFQRVFDKNCTYRVKPYEGIVSLLSELKARGMKLGVLSNKPDRQAVHVVSRIFGEDTFDIVWGQKEGVPEKAGSFRSSAYDGGSGGRTFRDYIYRRFRGGYPDRTGSGVKTVLVSWGFRQPEELRKAGAEIIVDSTREILEITKEQEEQHE